MNERLIFITGNSRSGTTMMGRIFGLHPQVHTFQELHFFEQLWSGNDRDKSADIDHAVKVISRLINIERNGYFTDKRDEDYKEEASLICTSVKKSSALHEFYKAFLFNESKLNGRIIPCEQTPQYVFYLNEILALFPKARIVIMVRDPRDVLLSQRNKWKRRWLGASGIPFRESIRSMVNYHPVTMSKLWNAAVSAGAKLQGHPNVFELKYESLISEPEKTIRDLCSFTGIEYNPAMLLVPQKGSSTSTDTGEAGVRSGNTLKWKSGDISKAELSICESITAVQRRRLGYDDSDIKAGLTAGLWKAWWPASIGLSFLFNLHRMRNLRETLRKRLAR